MHEVGDAGEHLMVTGAGQVQPEIRTWDRGEMWFEFQSMAVKACFYIWSNITAGITRVSLILNN